MRLKRAIENVEVIRTMGSLGASVSCVTHDSRQAGKGSVFVAIDGYRERGSDYIDSALSNGSRAVVCSDISRYREIKGKTFIQVKNPREALSGISANFFEHPSRDLNVIGVTGTNGKTTVCYLLESIAAAAARKTAVTGTINYRAPGIKRQAIRTTPEAHHLHSFLKEVRDSKVSDVIMEASSHAVYLKRLDHIHFDACIFTNLTSDHLDFHGTKDAYAQAKSLLFEKLLNRSCKKKKAAILNWDDPFSRKISEITNAGTIKYGFGGGCDIEVSSKSVRPSGIEAKIRVFGDVLHVRSDLIGAHNLSNILAAVAAAAFMGIGKREMERGIEDLKFVPGRLQKVHNSKGLSVYVDYAHTDDALHNVLSSLRKMARGRIITVFGCGGDRDRIKRPKMGSAVSALSDVAVITSDNPRSEDPSRIIDEILSGIDPDKVIKINGHDKEIIPGNKYYMVEQDRAGAIKRALSMAGKNDIVLIAGKGHEEYQEFRNRRVYFSDMEVASKALN